MTPEPSQGLQDPLLDNFVGNWHIDRQFPNRTAENEAVVEWVIEHRYLRIVMKDLNRPSRYEAHVYITFEQEAERYAIHWMDVFAGTMPESLGYGEKQGDSIVFTWQDADGTLKNTFTWNPGAGTWTSKIEQTDPSGAWTTFCTDTYRKK